MEEDGGFFVAVFDGLDVGSAPPCWFFDESESSLSAEVEPLPFPSFFAAPSEPCGSDRPLLSSGAEVARGDSGGRETAGRTRSSAAVVRPFFSDESSGFELCRVIAVTQEETTARARAPASQRRRVPGMRVSFGATPVSHTFADLSTGRLGGVWSGSGPGFVGGMRGSLGVATGGRKIVMRIREGVTCHRCVKTLAVVTHPGD